MKILKYTKTSKGRYKLYLDNDDSLLLYEDVIINNNLLIKKEILKEELEDILLENEKIHAYVIAIDYISIRVRSIKEIREYLLKKNINVVDVTNTIRRLQQEGYLDDYKFAKAYLNDQLLVTNKGPNSIRDGLIKYGVDKDIISQVIDDIDKDMLKERLSSLIEKQLKIRKGGAKFIRLKLINYLMNLGYDKIMIVDELSNYKLTSDKVKLRKDYSVLYNRYKTKYEKSELMYLITQKLYAKGYSTNEIKEVISEDNE